MDSVPTVMFKLISSILGAKYLVLILRDLFNNLNLGIALFLVTASSMSQGLTLQALFTYCVIHFVNNFVPLCCGHRAIFC